MLHIHPGRLVLVALTAAAMLTSRSAGAQAPSAEVVSVKQEVRATRIGKEGHLITVQVHARQLKDQEVRIGAFFIHGKEHLKAQPGPYRTPEGTLTVQAKDIPTAASHYTTAFLFLPYDQIDLPRRASYEVSFFIEVTTQQAGKTTLLTDAGPYLFTFPPPESAPSVAGLSGRWRGTEDLKGYGDLLFEFEPNGVSFMTDKDGRRQGTWKMDGGDVTLAFYNGAVVYRGTISGNSLSGTAVSGKMNWNWRATKEGGPSVVVTPPATAAISGRWTGTEDLKGYGALAFEFEPNAVSFMTDKDGRRQGTWKVEGNDVTLAFYNGACVYRGTVSGNSMSGSATSGKSNWNWRVTKEGGTPVVVTPPVVTPPATTAISGRWTGTEDLKGYGALAFEFEPNAVSFMTDKDGRRQGTWKVEGNDVTLAFYNGSVVYRGNVSGNSMSGTASSGKMNWNWRATKEGGPPVVVTPPVVTPPALAGLSGRWRGTEDLKGYGDLAFEFEPNGVSFMTDKDGRRQGTWKQDGNEVTLAFYNGSVVYRGTVIGATISGTATSGSRTWNWRVNRENGIRSEGGQSLASETVSKPAWAMESGKVIVKLSFGDALETNVSQTNGLTNKLAWAMEPSKFSPHKVDVAVPSKPELG